MKVAFIFDTVLVEKKDKSHYGMTLNYDFFKSRYLPMYDSMVITTRTKLEENTKGNISGYKIVNGKNVEVMPITSYNEIPDALKNKKKIKEELTEVISKVDKVIIRMPSVIGMFACDICNKLNKNYLIELVACPWDGYKSHTNPIGKLIAPIMYFNTKKYVKKAPNVLYVTTKFLQERYPTTGNQVGCSDVLVNDFNEQILKDRLKKLDNTNLNELNICTVANVGMKYKGHRFVFEAIAKLKKEGKNHKYYLIGNGNNEILKNLAKKLNIEENIIFVGSLPHNEIFEKLDNMDLYIQPSLQEGLCRALVEAMSRACPIIASDVGGNPELIDKEYIFKRKKTKELINILNKLTNTNLKQQAEVNYNKSLNFSNDKLTEIRTNFHKN